MTVEAAKEVLKKAPGGLSDVELKEGVESIKRVALIRTLWYPEVVDQLEESARSYLGYFDIKAAEIQKIEVPGSYELPLALRALFDLPEAQRPQFAVALGCVVRGGTPHFDFVCQALSQGVMSVSLETRQAIGFGILTLDNLAQAAERGGKGAEAAQAALFMYLSLRQWKKRG